ncbi:GAF domain-containing protein [Streptomyces sp. CB02460]|uniref:GAF domain-containing protein n=1 Tax=Streptomyces sp. CB02460 TaxID=1703941 RepID=UPI00093B35DE|nr:GAF domain-containing protein [Streptomyces sp. CB02460]OKJ72296.1 histidine kinase [Streptomyces sp. CB02460]
MSPHRNDSHLKRPSLPRGTTGDTGHGPFAPPATAAPDPQSAHAELVERYTLLDRLGVPLAGIDDYDAIARDMAQRAGFAYGFVNVFLDEQTFVGLHQPPPGSGYVIVGRTMSREHGWCPEVMNRKRALPLPDVHASPRFSGNPVVDAVGIRSYFGAPLIHESGVVLGTVCVIDPERRPLSDATRIRDIVIDSGAQVMTHMTHPPAGPFHTARQP